MCRQVAKQPGSHFCGQTCSDDSEKAGPMLLEVPKGHVTFKSGEVFVFSVMNSFHCELYDSCRPIQSFLEAYRDHMPSCAGCVQDPGTSIISCQLQHLPVWTGPVSLMFTSSVNDCYFSASVEARGQFVAAGRSIGNENRRWHGTRRECTLGDKGNTKFCGSQTCSLCCIVRTSFDLSLWGKKTGWGRCVIFVVVKHLISNILKIRQRDLYIFDVFEVSNPLWHRGVSLTIIKVK
jgi:hypothetical protein